MPKLIVPTEEEIEIPLSIDVREVGFSSHIKSKSGVSSEIDSQTETEAPQKRFEVVLPALSSIEKQRSLDSIKIKIKRRGADRDDVEKWKPQFGVDQKLIPAIEIEKRIEPHVPSPAHIESVRVWTVACACDESGGETTPPCQAEIVACVETRNVRQILEISRVERSAKRDIRPHTLKWSGDPPKSSVPDQ